ncbi:tRNA (adenosine(37)-N6)-dimethylallyltransferase MiaA [Actinomyces sp. oral taxon 170]|uniref:tRNA (adenosine(37)-N6)-dimethylallyltransferase MiaA n=1 Tax=Actinomyces sp. oral taxon 170 TaxID=712117 RepID=UPI000558A085|nr:tRNA (adenosine(37)-N6)-dimethylallyltransferase MiaA [Actinomyces sp. oral taxon 170]
MSPTASSTIRLPRVAVVGPTATGKSALALDLAERVQAIGPAARAEIINADASLLYRGMDIGTAKPTPVERAHVLHHQVDVLSVRDRASVAAFQRSARGDIDAVESRGHLPIIVGGSGLYVRALTDDLDFPGTDPAVRARLSERAEREGAPVLHAELSRVDPVAAERIEASNTRRIVRALEVIEITGRPFSASLPRYEDIAPTVHLALRCQRALLDLRISARARAMFEGGLVEEAEALVAEGLREGETASQAIGYAQALAVIDGRLSVDEAVASTALATRQLASRQIKWFRRDPRVHWIDVDLDENGRCTDQERSRVTRQAWEHVLASHDVA